MIGVKAKRSSPFSKKAALFCAALSCLTSPAFGLNHFKELPCNANLNTAECKDWDIFAVNQTLSDEVKIPCGECVTMSITDGRMINLAGGLNVVGKLHIPEDAAFTLKTPYFLVQGVVRMDPPAPGFSTIPRPDGRVIKVVLTGSNDIQFTPEPDNSMVCDPCSIGTKPFAVAGGRLDLHAIDDSCPAWTKLDSLSQNMTQVTLTDPAATDCWAPGAELLFTPDGVANHGETQVATIASVDAGGIITLTAPLSRKVTAVQDGYGDVYAVEVALLTRRVTFEPEDNTNLIGGHTIVMNSKNVVQKVSGVEFRRFGQQGNLGRYPFHFHMSESVYGSVVSKNLVRESNQRCFVIHGTHNVTLYDNVAFDTFGHCFMTEDGGEWDNYFIGNLGSKQKKPSKIIRSGESDGQPTTFWMPTPVNHYIGNVAAGSNQFGFWLEPKIRSPSKDLPINQGKNPSSLNLGTFDDNVAHSNGGQGIAFYPLSYRPPSAAVSRRLVSTRNGAAGIRVGGAERIRLEGGLVADNMGGGVETSGGKLNIVKDMTVVLKSAHQEMLLADGRSTKNPCSVGITYPNDKGPGSEFYGVKFEGYNGTGCSKTALAGSNISPRHRLLQSFPIFSNLTFDSETHRISVCAATSGSKPIRNIAYDDLTATVTPAGGFLVQDDDPALTTFLPEGNCTALGGSSCLLSCPDACFRHVRFVTSAAAIHEGMKMVATERNVAGSPSAVTPRYIFKRFWGSHDVAYFGIALPGGKQYDVSFIDAAGEDAWPGYVTKVLSPAPDCTPNLSAADVAVVYPSPNARCDNPIYNGDLERGDYFGWLQVHSAGLAMMNGGAEGTANALRTTKVGRNGWHGLVNYLDVSCLRAWGGNFIRLSGFFRALDMDLQDVASGGEVYLRIDGVTLYKEGWVGIKGDGTWAKVDTILYLAPSLVANAQKAVLELEGAHQLHIAIDEWKIDNLGSTSFGYEVWPKGSAGGCPEGYHITTSQECRIAGEAVGATFRNDAVVTGSWSHVPCGCSLSGNGEVHFDTSPNACNDNDGNWSPLCRQMPSVAPSVSKAPTVSSAPSLSLAPSANPSISAAPTSTYYLGCGARGSDCDGQVQEANPGEHHEVRCCADEALSGWTRSYNTCPENVWGESELGGPRDAGCYDAETYWSAKSICENAGGRLCTLEELLADCTRGSGCEHDQDMIWSSSEVIPTNAPTVAPTPHPSTVSPTVTLAPSSSSVFLGCGSSVSGCGGLAQEANPFELHEVRCCSDTALTGWTKYSTCPYNVWGESELGGPRDAGCYDAETYSSAASICENAGGRLCTINELLADCTRATGCEHDKDMIWSQSKVTSSEYYLGCGARSATCKGQRQVASHSEKHEVRCCRNGSSSGWNRNYNTCPENVWGESVLGTSGDGCYHAETFSSAVSICENAGGRLCTVEELLADCTRGSGCSHDNDFIWSSSKVI